MTTQITNQNIRMLVYDYCTNQSKLPDDLKKMPIGKWDVSQVENGLNKLIPEYILKWYKLHSHDPHKFTTETKEQRLDNLRNYLLSFFP